MQWMLHQLYIILLYTLSIYTLFCVTIYSLSLSLLRTIYIRPFPWSTVWQEKPLRWRRGVLRRCQGERTAGTGTC